ncbi:HlyD family efflux transporter periplasmic adaptor subunit [Mariprofundus erugo]|uniref:HlyD family efflux transporter periplasmic adaptor subunit n=1 Tax=Mariprofundus erugo TaxID=2528639 RepID=A0A5R9GPD7_9PROT|nr:HlyD family efflux transporter periplasmic adaptor subunit [Mariprofundus erugo]TLS66157.1 HlyD family efflux transporter periplasmic adaptor subunit [Mariprofundus erugo]
MRFMHLPPFAAALLALMLLPGCSADAPDYFQGYLEGEYIQIAPEHAGRIETIAVTDGQQVKKGQWLFSLDDAHEKLLLEQAMARQSQLTAMLADLEKGARPPEIAALLAGKREAAAALSQAKDDLVRLQSLAGKDFVAASQLEQARTRVIQRQASEDRLDAELAVAKLGGREDRIRAARAELAVAEAAVADATRLLAESRVTAPADGLVDRLIRRVGEISGATVPVLRFLPAGDVKVIFFVPEALRAGLEPGREVRVSCDGCGQPRTARISRLASEAEFTPPVLFNRDNRDKLMFRIEARYSEPVNLTPGLPVEVRQSLKQ